MTTNYAMNRLDAYLRRYFEAEPRLCSDKIKLAPTFQTVELNLFEMVEMVRLAAPNWPVPAHRREGERE